MPSMQGIKKENKPHEEHKPRQKLEMAEIMFALTKLGCFMLE